VWYVAFTGQTGSHGAASHCWHITGMNFALMFGNSPSQYRSTRIHWCVRPIAA
jgi:hypothetical protein